MKATPVTLTIMADNSPTSSVVISQTPIQEINLEIGQTIKFYGQVYGVIQKEIDLLSSDYSTINLSLRLSKIRDEAINNIKTYKGEKK